MNTSGKLVKTKSGKSGRTFNYKGLINGKVPVYLLKDGTWDIEDMPMLCDPKKLRIIGYID